MDKPEIIIDNRYTIDDLHQDLLSSGGYGSVYKGIDIQTKQAVAIKVLKPEIVASKPDLVARFVREGEALRQLNHPNIVKMLMAVEDAGQHYLIMEYIPGGDLQGLLNEQPQLPLKRILQIGLELADALTRAHHLHIIHRDLKPGNVLLAEDGSLRLTDFGIAHVGDGQQLTQTGMLMGTVDYLSPEACNGDKLDARADIWAFGVMLFEMIGGKRPFYGDSIAATLTAILTQPVPDLTQYRSDVPSSLKNLIERMLVKDREERIASVRQVAFELEALKDGKSIESNLKQMENEQWDKAWNIGYEETPDLPALTPSTFSPERRKQLILLEKVKNAWVKGVLEKSVLDATMIDLSRQRCDDLVDRPWGSLLGTSDNAILSTQQKNIIIFKETDRALLILGNPGAGKTTSLIVLARDLIELAERDPEQPIPVVLNLASWAEQRGALADWVVEELTAKYQIPRKIGRPWLENDQMLLLLDGLDEVQTEHQAACVSAINKFRETQGLTGIVVCSRVEEYGVINTQLKLGGAIRLYPLTSAQIDDYLAAAGSQLVALRRAVQQDPTLQEMAQSPLMLSVMSLAYSGGFDGSGDDLKGDFPDLVDKDTQTRRRHLFETYVHRMFQRRSPDLDYSPEQVKQWLAWLAQKMSQQDQPVFLIERLQPSWLSHRFWRWLYLLTSRLVIGFIIGIWMWLAFLLAIQIEMPTAFEAYAWMANLLQLPLELGGLFFLVAINLGWGLVLVLVDFLRIEHRQSQSAESVTDASRRWLFIVIFSGLIALVTGFVFNLLDEPGSALMIGLTHGFVWALNLFFAVYRPNFRADIRTVDALQWSWKDAAKGLLPGLVVGGLMSVVYTQISDSFLGWAAGISWVLALFLINGLRHNRVEASNKPNQGIRLSVRNSILAATLFALFFGLLWGLMWNWPSGLIMGLLMVAMGWIFYGAFDALKHYLLRLFLWHHGHMPLNYAHFLDHAAGLVFLRKVGGGYIFIHRMLLEYFAELYDSDKD